MFEGIAVAGAGNSFELYYSFMADGMAWCIELVYCLPTGPCAHLSLMHCCMVVVCANIT
jgi:hypothetical protein